MGIGLINLRSVALLLLVPLGFPSVQWSKEPGPVIHPIQKLLTAYRPSVPPESEVRSAGRIKGAIESTLALLDTAASRQLWPSAIVVLGMLGDTTDILDKLIAFEENGRPFGCLRSSTETRCLTPAHDVTTRRFEDAARLNVPLALGYLLRQARDPADAAFLRILEKLSDMSGDTYADESASWSCQSTTIETRVMEMQFNAVRALSLSGKSEAKDRLLVVATTGKNPLVRQEAKYAFERFEVIPHD